MSAADPPPPVPAAAEQPPDADTAAPQPRLVEYVQVDARELPSSNTVSTKLPLEVFETPASVGTVAAPLLREQRAMVLGDALVNISGVNVINGFGVFDSYTIRGFDALSNGLVMTDGVAEPEATFYPTYNVEGVELLKGPGGFLYGKDPLAGAVNVVRKQPLPATFGTFAGSVGSFGTAEGSIDWNHGGEDQPDFRVIGMWRESDGWRDRQESRHAGINPSAGFDLGRRGTLNLNLEYVEAEFTPDSGLPLLLDGSIADVPRRRSYQSPFDFSEQEIGRLQLDYELPIGERLRLRAKAYHRGLDWRSSGTIFNGAFPDGEGSLEVSRTLTLLDDRQRFSGTQLEALATLGSGRVRHHLLAGIELVRAGDDFASVVAGLPALDLFDPNESASEIVPFPFLAADSTNRTIAPYALDQMRIGGKLAVLLGARLDALDTDVRYGTNAQEPGITSYERSDAELSPMAGVVVEPSANLALYASAGRSFAPIGPRVRGAAELGPEQSRQVEVGAKRRFGPRFAATVAVYQLERENFGIPDETGLIQDAGDQRSRGLELDLAAELGRGVRAFLAYAHTDAELTRFAETVRIGPEPTDFVVIDRTGNDPPAAPAHLARVWLARTFASGLGLAGGLRWTSAQYVAPDNAVRLDSAVVGDATLFYDWGQCRVRLNLQNVTDAEYEVPGFTAASVAPGAPFAAYGGFDWRF